MLSFVPRGVLDEILNLIESVSEGFPSYFFNMLFYLVHVVPFDYVSTQEFGSIVSERFNTEKTHMLFSHELL